MGGYVVVQNAILPVTGHGGAIAAKMRIDNQEQTISVLRTL
ncbi:MAG: hypothetical protein ACUVT2_12005 [Thiobacillaceae bacterium]